MQRLLDGLGEYPTVLTIVSGLGAAVSGAGLRQSWGTIWVIGWLTGLAAFLYLPALSTNRNRLQQGRRAARNCIRHALEACAAAYGSPDRHVRANIMLARENGRKRRVDTETAFNMAADPGQRFGDRRDGWRKR